MNIRKLTLLLIIINTNILALVDYSESSGVKKTKRIQTTAKSKKKRFLSVIKSIELSGYFKTTKYLMNNKSGKLDTIELRSLIKTGYDLYLSINYPFHSERRYLKNKGSSYQAGNGTFSLGLNWFKLGKKDKIVNFNFVLGLTVPGKGKFTSKRNHTSIAFITSKKFHSFNLLLEYQLTSTGKSSDPKEQDIGNIRKLKLQISQIISNDIKFILDFRSIIVKQSKEKNKINYLKHHIKYSFISPKLILNFSPRVNLELSAIFQIKRPKYSLISAETKLWQLEGTYGNSINIGFKIIL